MWAPKTSTPKGTRLAVVPLEDRAVPAFLTPISSAGGGRAVAAADLNHDGQADIAVIGDKNAVAIRLSNDDGTFRSGDTLTGAQGYYLNRFQITDVNADGHPDVVVDGLSKHYTTVVTNLGWTTEYWYTAYHSVWPGKGDGTFGRKLTSSGPVVFYSRVYRDSVATPQLFADVDRDGITDFMHVVPPAGAIEVHLNNAAGTPVPPLTFPAGSIPGALAVGDFNGDGWTDVVVVNDPSSSSPTLSVLLNDGIW